MTQQQRIEAFILRVQAEFNALQAGTKTVEIADRLNDGAAGTTLAEITTARDTAIQTAVNGLLEGVPVAGNTLNKLYVLIQGLAGGGFVTQADIDNAITALVGTSPAILDTLGEIATALGNDPDFANTIISQLALKANIADVYTQSAANALFLTITAFNDAIGNPDADLVAVFETGLL